MGTKKETKLIILIVILLPCCILVYSQNRIPETISKPSLSTVFSEGYGFEPVRHLDLPNDLVEMLDLDDYIWIDYKSPEDQSTNLYVGYYYSANKSYSSHSPTVCYPSQGWTISEDVVKNSIQTGPYQINYQEIVASLGDRQELVLYWYQTGKFTNTQVYKNKIYMGYNKLMHNSEQHAFVRVAVPIEQSLKQSRILAINFIKAFYPKLADYMVE